MRTPDDVSFSPRQKKNCFFKALLSERKKDTQNFGLGSGGASRLAVVKSMPVCAPPLKLYRQQKKKEKKKPASKTRKSPLGTGEGWKPIESFERAARTFSFVALIQQSV